MPCGACGTRRQLDVKMSNFDEKDDRAHQAFGREVERLRGGKDLLLGNLDKNHRV